MTMTIQVKWLNFGWIVKNFVIMYRFDLYLDKARLATKQTCWTNHMWAWPLLDHDHYGQMNEIVLFHPLTMKFEPCTQLNFDINWPWFWLSDLLSCFLMYSYEIWAMCITLTLSLKLNFNISWPRFWPNGLLSCPLMYSYEIWTMCRVLHVKLNFYISWPRFWPGGILSCPFIYSYTVWSMCTVLDVKLNFDISWPRF
jgi:hypothetical protein